MNKKILLLLCCIASFTAWAFFDGHQTPYTATGIVTDEKNNPLPDVVVAEVGVNNQTKTGADGHYSLNINNPKATIRFSFIGYEMQVLQVSGASNNNIVLKKITSQLNEVVVTGISKMMRKNIMGQPIMSQSSGQYKTEDLSRDYERADEDALPNSR